MSRQLTTNVLLQGQDGLSGVLSRMASNTQSTMKRIEAQAVALRTQLSSLPIMGGALAGVFSVSNVFGQEADWSKAAQRFKAITGAVGPEWARIEGDIYKTSNATTLSREKVLHLAQAYKEMGGEVKNINADMLKLYANMGRLADIPADVLMKETRALAIAYKKDPEDLKLAKETEDLLLTAIKSTPKGSHFVPEYLKKAGPIGGLINLPKHQLLAYGSIMGRENFEGGDAGRAFATVTARFLGPSKDNRRELEAMGISQQKLFDLGVRPDGKLIDDVGLQNRLQGMGYWSPTVAKAAKRFTDKLNSISPEDFAEGKFDIEGARREFMNLVGKDARKHGQNPDTVSKAIDQEVSKAIVNFNWEKALDLIAEMPGSSVQKLLGKEHWMKILPLARNKALREKTMSEYAPEKTAGTVEKMIKELNQGFGFEFDRFKNTFHNILFGSMGSGSGATVSSDLGGIFKTLTDLMESTATAKPDAFRQLFWGLTGLAALPAGVFALRAVGSALSLVGLAALAPVRWLGALNAYPYAKTAAGIGMVSAAMGRRGGVLGMTAPAVGLLGKGVGFLGSLARLTGWGIAIAGAATLYQNWDSISASASEWWKGFGQTDKGKAMSEHVGQLKGSLKELQTAATDAGIAILKALGYESGPDAQGKAKTGTAALLDAMAQLLDTIIQKATTLTRMLTKIAQGDLPGAMAVLDDPEWRAQKRAETSPLQEKGNQMWRDWNGGPWGMFRQKYIDPIVPKGWEMFPELDFSPDEYWRRLGFPKRAEPQPEAERLPGMERRTPGGMPLSMLPFTPFSPGDRPMISIDPNTSLKATIEQAVPVTITTQGKIVVEAQPGITIKENTVFFKGAADATPPATGNGTGIKR